METIRRDVWSASLWESDGIARRYKLNPILEANGAHFWESKMVYNAAAFKIEQIAYIVYRAIGHDHISRLGLAWTKNGIDIVGRLAFPIFEPVESYESPPEEDRERRAREKGGCEDPRITVIDGKIFMVYTAYCALCQIAIASIDVTAFKQLVKDSVFGRYDLEEQMREKWNIAWQRHGLVFPENVKEGIFSRNACVFPIETSGRVSEYALIYRLATHHVMIAYSHTPIGPWKAGQELLTPTERWEAERMGICSPPIRTDKGMFLFYHGVDNAEGKDVIRTYRLGGIYLNFNSEDGKIDVKVSKVREPILSPERGYEVQSDWLEPRDVFAVFCCGALPLGDKSVVENDEEILIYYGAGDVRICVARVKHSTLSTLANL